jgi:hypothetical protein
VLVGLLACHTSLPQGACRLVLLRSVPAWIALSSLESGALVCFRFLAWRIRAAAQHTAAPDARRRAFPISHFRIDDYKQSDRKWVPVAVHR